MKVVPSPRPEDGSPEDKLPTYHEILELFCKEFRIPGSVSIWQVVDELKRRLRLDLAARTIHEKRLGESDKPDVIERLNLLHDKSQDLASQVRAAKWYWGHILKNHKGAITKHARNEIELALTNAERAVQECAEVVEGAVFD